MKTDTINTRYRKHIDLNPNTPSTGTVTFYDGQIIDADKPDDIWEDQFIEIADCRGKVKLHRASYDTQEDWLNKVTELHKALSNYLEYLKLKNRIETLKTELDQLCTEYNETTGQTPEN